MASLQIKGACITEGKHAGMQELESMVERATTQASEFGPEISDSVFWFATKVRHAWPVLIVAAFPALRFVMTITEPRTTGVGWLHAQC